MLSYLCSTRDTRMSLAAAHPDPLNIRWQGPVLEGRLSLREALQPGDTQALTPSATCASILALFRKITSAFGALRGQALNKTKGKPVFHPSENWLWLTLFVRNWRSLEALQ